VLVVLEQIFVTENHLDLWRPSRKRGATNSWVDSVWFQRFTDTAAPCFPVFRQRRRDRRLGQFPITPTANCQIDKLPTSNCSEDGCVRACHSRRGAASRAAGESVSPSPVLPVNPGRPQKPAASLKHPEATMNAPERRSWPLGVGNRELGVPARRRSRRAAIWKLDVGVIGG